MTRGSGNVAFTELTVMMLPAPRSRRWGNAARVVRTAAKELQIAGKCLGAAGNGTANGTQVITYTCNGTPSQVWNFDANGNVTNALSGLCLDVANNATANGSPVILWQCTGGSNQKWTRV